MAYDSRLLKGTLTFGETGTPFAASCQVTNFVIEQQDGDDEDAVTVLCGDVVGGGTLPGDWHMTGTAIQDFDAATGSFIKWTYDNRNTEQPFTFTPNDNASSPTITGTARVKFLGLGGDVNARITRDFDWSVVDEPEFVWPEEPPAGLAASSTTSKAPEPANA